MVGFIQFGSVKISSIQQRNSTKRRFKKLAVGLVATLSVGFGGLVSAHKFLEEVLTEANLGASSIFNSVANIELTKAEVLALLSEKQPVDYYLQASKQSACKGERQCIKQLVAVPRLEEDSCEASGSKTCGQFDHFSMARTAAIITCHTMADENPELYPNGLIPMYNGPSTFVDLGTASDEHHINYNLDHGLNFNCGYLSWILKDKVETR